MIPKAARALSCEALHTGGDSLVERVRAREPSKALLVVAGVWVASCGLGACTGWYDDDARLSHYREEMTKSLHDVRVALALHHDQVLDATSPSAIEDLEKTHVDEANRRMAGAESAQIDIAKCTVGRFAEHKDEWQAIYEADMATHMSSLDIHLEMLRHARAMRATADLSGMLDEESVHRTNVGELVAIMEDQSNGMTELMESLEKSGVSTTCSPRTHMH